MKDLDLFGTKRREEELRYAILLAQVQEYNRLAREYGKPEKKLPLQPKISALRAFFVRLDLFGINKKHKQEIREEAQIAAKQERAAVRCKFERERMERAEMLEQTGVAKFLNIISNSHVELKDGIFWVADRFFVERANQKVYVSEYPDGAKESSVVMSFPGAQWQMINRACQNRIRSEALELDALQKKISSERLNAVLQNSENEK